MADWLARTEILLGKDAIEKLKNSRVIVFGVGGVGGYAVEALARSGVGKIDLVDNDTVSLTNLNRQIVATVDTIGKSKTEVCKERILSINPDCEVNCINMFYLPEESDKFNFADYDYIVDAVDTVSAKISLAENAQRYSVPSISSMGAGNKLDPTRFEVCDIYKTSVCPLARVMRTELRKRSIKSLKVVYSKEPVVKPKTELSSDEKRVPGSCAFVPSVAGLIIAGEVIKDLTGRGVE